MNRVIALIVGVIAIFFGIATAPGVAHASTAAPAQAYDYNSPATPPRTPTASCRSGRWRVRTCLCRTGSLTTTTLASLCRPRAVAKRLRGEMAVQWRALPSFSDLTLPQRTAPFGMTLSQLKHRIQEVCCPSPLSWQLGTPRSGSMGMQPSAWRSTCQALPVVAHRKLE